MQRSLLLKLRPRAWSGEQQHRPALLHCMHGAAIAQQLRQAGAQVGRAAGMQEGRAAKCDGGKREGCPCRGLPEAAEGQTDILRERTAPSAQSGACGAPVHEEAVRRTCTRANYADGDRA